jgi:hypothetical protein
MDFGINLFDGLSNVILLLTVWISCWGRFFSRYSLRLSQLLISKVGFWASLPDSVTFEIGLQEKHNNLIKGNLLM